MTEASDVGQEEGGYHRKQRDVDHVPASYWELLKSLALNGECDDAEAAGELSAISLTFLLL